MSDPRIRFADHLASRPVNSSEQTVAGETGLVNIELIRPGIER